jgi:hypothetical protein
MQRRVAEVRSEQQDTVRAESKHASHGLSKKSIARQGTTLAAADSD